MSIKHNDILILEDDPFKNCKLDRKKYADVLTSIVGSYSDGFVLAINNEWGTGKTTFVKMWEQQLKNEEFKTLYFNAWENDFEINPLTAILAELKGLLPRDNRIAFNSLLTKGAVIAQNVFPAIAKGLAKKYIDIEEVSSGIEGAAKAATEILKDEIKRYTARQKGLKEFRKELEKYVSNIETSKPLVFIIDELDRCRPDYAVEVLEQMKHFFTVKGIVFVLAIDKVQLGNAIKGVYGSEQLNSEEYLRRFIDLEYTIPPPTTSAFCNYLYEYYKFDDFFQSEFRGQYNELRGERKNFLDFASLLFENKKFSLRQIEKMFAHARLGIKSFSVNDFVFPPVYIFLIYLHTYHKELYNSIRNRSLNLQEFVDKIENTFPIDMFEKGNRFPLYFEAQLLFFYFNFYRESNHSAMLVEENAELKKKILLVKSKVDPDPQNSLMIPIFDTFERANFYLFKLDFLLNRIDLIENIKE